MTIYPLPHSGLCNTYTFTDNVMNEGGRQPYVKGRGLCSNNANNPINSGDPYANAMLGIYTSYTQANTNLSGWMIYNNVEPYIQDTWKVTHRFTLDVGIRLSWIPPMYNAERQANYFVPSKWDPSQAVRLYAPVLVSGARRAVDPANMPGVLTTQNTLPTTYVGLIVPNSGNPYNGIVQAKNGYYPGGLQNRGVQWGPRFGFAYDLTGKGKTVVRGGYGISYDRPQGNVINTQITTPPTVRTPQLLYGYLSDVANSSGFLAPSSLSTYPPDGKIPNVHSFSLGVQRNLGFGTVIDIAYVGTLGRHLLQSVNINAVPYLTTFHLSAQDPSQYTGGVVPAVEPGLQPAYSNAGFSFAGDKALPTNFLQPYAGYGSISYRQFTGSSNYNALQISAKRSVGRGLTFGVAYTYSKAFDTANADFNANNAYNTRAYDYQVSSYDRTQVLVVNYVYDLPKVAMHFTGARVANAIVNNWHVSVVTTQGLRSQEPVATPYMKIQRLLQSHHRLVQHLHWQPRSEH